MLSLLFCGDTFCTGKISKAVLRLESVFEGLNNPAGEVIVAWGNLHQTSRVVNRAKLEDLKMCGRKCKGMNCFIS